MESIPNIFDGMTACCLGTTIIAMIISSTIPIIFAIFLGIYAFDNPD